MSQPLDETSFDVARARRETPGCERILHLNSAGASLTPEPVLRTVVDHLEREAHSGGYEAADAAHADLERAYDNAAELLGCSADEVAFVENATRAWDLAFHSLPLEPGDRVLTGKAEYVSNYLGLLQAARRRGVEVEVVPDDEHGQISLDALEHAIDRRTKLISLTHAPSHSGLVNPVAEVGRVARAAGVPYLLDATQSVGQLPVDVATIGCDFLAVTGRKFLRGPRGTGLLVVRREILDRVEPPFIDLIAARWVAPAKYELRADARRFECFESFVAGRLGLAAAIRYALAWDLAAIRDRVRSLAARLRTGLTDISGVTVHDRGAELSAIVTFSIDRFGAADAKRTLAARGMHLSIIPRNRLDMAEHRLEFLLRASPHYYNTTDEVDRVVTTIAELVAAATRP